MPQMMPLLWLFMLILSITILFFLISFIYYMYLPSISPNVTNPNLTRNLKSNWSWLW